MSNVNTQSTQKLEWHERVDHVRNVIEYIAKQAKYNDALEGVAERLEQEFEALVDQLAKNDRVPDSVKAGSVNEFETRHVAEHELMALRQFLTHVTENHKLAPEIATAYGAEALKVIRESYEGKGGEIIQTSTSFAIQKGRILRWSIGNYIAKEYAKRRKEEDAKNDVRRREQAFSVYNRVSDELVGRFGISPIRVNGRLADEDTSTDQIWEQTNRLSEALIEQFLGWAKSVNNPGEQLLAQIAQAENEEEKMGRRVYAARGAFFEAKRILQPREGRRRQPGGEHEYSARKNSNVATPIATKGPGKKQRQRRSRAEKKAARDAAAVDGLSS